MKLSAFYGKEVESADGTTRGWVRAVLGIEGEPQFLQCFDEDEREFDVDIKNVISAKEKVIFEDRLSARKNSKCMRLGIPAYSEEGKFLGHISDIEFGKSGVTAYIIGKKKRRPQDVFLGDVAIVRAQRTLKDDVTDANGTIILKKGSPLTADALGIAESAGEYFQAQMKTI